ncbi:MAG: DUF2911 domain-containing protein [Terriglobales bacterium]
MRAFCVILLSPLLLTVAAAQQSASGDQSMTADCTFADGNQISVQYSTSHKEEPQNGKVWAPGGSALVLFAQTPLVLNNVQIPIGGYTAYVIPGKKTWTLIVSRNTAVGANYDASQDLVRASLETAQLSEPANALRVSFAHMAPKLCNLRLDYGKTGAFGADFQEK